MVDLIAVSIALEKDTGADSIPTIERVYEQNENGTLLCCFPGCKYLRRNPESMWMHVHFGSHGRPYGTLHDVLEKWGPG